MLIGIPIRSFATAKTRLAEHLTADRRRQIALQLATHTVAIAASVAEVVIVTGDSEVRQWARAQSLMSIDDGGNLDRAGSAIVRHADRQPWGLLHADLPRLESSDLHTAFGGFEDCGSVIAPSWDGGTSLIVGTGPFSFSYGAGSFHRHLSHRPDAAVVVRAGLALDVDEPEHVTWMQRSRLLE